MHYLAPNARELTVADVLDMFGPVSARRIRNSPSPGTATEKDVVAIADREDHLCELVQGVLLEKDMGFWESILASRLNKRLSNFVDDRYLGMVAGEAGMLKLSPGLIRILDVFFISRTQLAGQSIKGTAVPALAPDLAIEVLSEGNTDREMSQKLDDYFGAGVRLVWYFDPDAKVVTVYTSRNAAKVLHESDTLDGGDVLPGFTLPLAGFFDEPNWLRPESREGSGPLAFSPIDLLESPPAAAERADAVTNDPLNPQQRWFA